MPPAAELGIGAKDGFIPRLSHPGTASQSRRDPNSSTIGEETPKAFDVLMAPSSNTKTSHWRARDKTQSTAPSIPRKPTLLSSKGSPSLKPGTDDDRLFRNREAVRSAISAASVQNASPGFPSIRTGPPPLQQNADPYDSALSSRRVASLERAVDVRKSCDNHIDEGPALPPRAQRNVGPSLNLMDESDSQVARMDFWKPLRPR